MTSIKYGLTIASVVMTIGATVFCFATKASAENAADAPNRVAGAAVANSMSKVAAPTKVAIDDVISIYQPMAKKKLTPDQNDLLMLSLIARDALEMKEFEVYGSQDSSKKVAARLGPPEAVGAINAELSRYMNLDKIKSANALKEIRQNRDRLKTLFGPTSSTWAWFLYQLGDNTDAKKVSAARFESEYQRIMKLESFSGFGDESGTAVLNQNNAILQKLSDDKEKKQLQEKVRKAETHISQIPNNQIMT